MNEGEEPTVCAAREVEEEVGYDISEKISEKLFIQKFVNETLVRLYLITDVPVDYHYAPKTRNEIGLECLAMMGLIVSYCSLFFCFLYL